MHQIILSTSNLRTLMPCQGYLFSMSTIHFAIFTVTGFCRLCQCSLFSLHLDNFVSNAMPGLLVFHVHHTFCNFHSDWILQDLPIFTFQPGVDSWFTVRQFCTKCHASATCCPCPPYICNIQVEWLDYAGFANFLFLTSQSAVSLANQSTPSQPKLLPQFVYGISPQNPPHPP